MMVWIWVIVRALVLGTVRLFRPNLLVHSIARSPRRIVRRPPRRRTFESWGGGLPDHGSSLCAPLAPRSGIPARPSRFALDGAAARPPGPRRLAPLIFEETTNARLW